MGHHNSLDSALKYLNQVDPTLSRVIQKMPPLESSPREANFEGLCRIIINQQLSGAAAKTIFKKLKTILGNKKITPKLIQNVKEDKIRACGISTAKTVYLKGLSKHFIDHPQYLNHLKNRDSECVIGELKKIKGIGDWSSRIFALSYLQHPDIFAVGDATIYKAISRLYGSQYTANTDSLNILIKKWSPHNSTACRVLWNWVDAGMQ